APQGYTDQSAAQFVTIANDLSASMSHAAFLTFVTRAIPVVGTIDAFREDGVKEGLISAAGDALLFAGVWAKGLQGARAASAARTIHRANIAVEGTIAGIRGVEAV